MLESVLWIIAGYLVGSIPFAYLCARAAKGIDLRRVGSRNVGASNVWEHVGFGAFVLVTIADILKGTLPIVLGRLWNLDSAATMAAGLAAIAGHNWPIWLCFVGGRGIATSFGMLFIAAPIEAVAWGLVIVAGWLVHQSALATLVGLVLLPVLAGLMQESAPVVAACAGVSILAVTKRLAANPGQSIPPGQRRQVLLYRLLFDRDIRDEAAWIKRAGFMD